MKNKFSFILVCLLTSAVSWAGVPGDQLEVAPEAGISAPGTGPYDVGFGGGLFAGFRVAPSLAVGADISAYSFTASSIPGIVQATGGITTLEVTVKSKFRTSNAPIHLIFMAGGGIGFFSNSTTSINYPPFGDGTTPFTFKLSLTDPLLEGGLGPEVSLGPGAELYLLGQVDYLFDGSGNFWHLPVLAGAEFSF